MPHTKQMRLSHPAALSAATKNKAGAFISVVLNDGKTIFGTLIEQQQSSLVLLNARRKRIDVAFADINEIYLDSVLPC